MKLRNNPPEGINKELDEIEIKFHQKPQFSDFFDSCVKRNLWDDDRYNKCKDYPVFSCHFKFLGCKFNITIKMRVIDHTPRVNYVQCNGSKCRENYFENLEEWSCRSTHCISCHSEELSKKKWKYFSPQDIPKTLEDLWRGCGPNSYLSWEDCVIDFTSSGDTFIATSSNEFYSIIRNISESDTGIRKSLGKFETRFNEKVENWELNQVIDDHTIIGIKASPRADIIPVKSMDSVVEYFHDPSQETYIEFKKMLEEYEIPISRFSFLFEGMCSIRIDSEYTFRSVLGRRYFLMKVRI